MYSNVPDTPTLAGLRILIIVNKDWGFLTYRVPLARALQRAGAEVLVAGGATGREGEIQAVGFPFFSVPFDRGSINPLRELRTTAHLYRLLRQLKPDVVHNIAVKASLYGGVAAVAAGTPQIINSLTGLGYLFTSKDTRAAILRAALSPLYRLLGAKRQLHYIFYNSDDQSRFISSNFASPERSSLTPGSGVDLARFFPVKPTESPIRVVMCARLLWDKGVGDLVAALRILKARGVALRATVAGASDPSNPSAISPEQLDAWRREGLVEFPGFVQETPRLLQSSSIAVLPSFYGEGVPLFLLEALATGLPIVTTTTAGCRDTVVDGRNGLLVPPQDPARLADALEQLALDSGLRARMGSYGRTLAEERFSTEQIGAGIISLYERICGRQ